MGERMAIGLYEIPIEVSLFGSGMGIVFCYFPVFGYDVCVECCVR